MLYQAGTVDEAAVKAAKGDVLEDGSGVRVGGWLITTRKGPITPDAEVERIKSDLGALAAPEQFFGDNVLQLTHEASGTTLRFTALDALKGWLADQSPAVHVGESAEWLRSRQADVQAHAAETLDYDWTFTTSYDGSLACSPAGERGVGRAPASGPRWEATGAQINRGLLTSRDPILYYDELALYESELDDHGSSRVGLKVRVMPRCWYVLVRFWLRVDRVMVRLRETRVFCEFGGAATAPCVLREVRHHEGTFQALRAAGAPAEGPAYADADTAAAALMAVAPVGVTHYRLEQLRL